MLRFARLSPLVAILAFALPAVAQGGDQHPAGVHILTMGPNGATCDQAEEAAVAARMAPAKVEGVRLTAVSSTNPAGSTAFKIILRATDQLLAEPEALLSFRRAAARWERIIQSPITTVIDVDFGPTRFGTPYPSNNVIGSANSAITSTPFTAAQFVDFLETNTTDPQLLELYGAIPVPIPTTFDGGGGSPINMGRLLAGLITRQVYDAAPAVLDASTSLAVPNIGFNSGFSFDFDPRDGVSTSALDFEGVAAHEIGHTLGFVSSIGFATASNPVAFPWDLFRVRPDAVEDNEDLTDGIGWEVAERVLTPGPGETTVLETVEGVTFFVAVQAFFDGFNRYETSTAAGDGSGGDGNQASHWRDDARRSPSLGADRKIGIMDPNAGFGERDEITDADIRLLEVIGYAVDYDPASSDVRYTLDGQALDTESVLAFDAPFSVGGIAVGATGTTTIGIENVDAATDLDYQVEFVLGEVFASSAVNVSVTGETVGSLAPGTSTDVVLSYTADADAVVTGTVLLRSNDETQYVAAIPIAFTVGSASFPTLTAATVQQEAQANVVTPITISATNPSAVAPTDYFRVLEPAVSLGAPAARVFEGVVEPSAPQARESSPTPDAAPAPGEASGVSAAARSSARASLVLPDAILPLAMTELGDGRLLIANLSFGGDGNPPVGTQGLYLVEADLSSVTELPAPAGFGGDLLLGMAYDDLNDTVWISRFDLTGPRTNQLLETRLTETGLEFTGEQIGFGFFPISAAYSPELDAFFLTQNPVTGDDVPDPTTISAFSRDGTPLPGYPLVINEIEADNTVASISINEGIIEILDDAGSGGDRVLTQIDQFGRTFPDAAAQVFDVNNPDLEGASRIFAYVRARADYDGTAYVVTDTGSDGENRVVSIDPADFPARVGSSLNATATASVIGSLGSGASRDLSFELDTRGRSDEDRMEVLAYLVDDPSDPIAEIAIDLSIRPVDTAEGAEATFALAGAVPNPVGSGGAIRLTVATPGDVEVALYNVLGQRVAVLHDGPLAAGPHDLPLGAEALASGTYLIRVIAGDERASRTITVVR